MRKQFLEAGKIVGTHGIRGAVRVQPWSDSGDFLEKFKLFYLDSLGKSVITAERIQPGNSTVIIKFKGIESIEAAEKLRGSLIYINRDDVRLPEGRYFINDLLGCEVTDADSGAILGKITDVSATGANDVWHIRKDGREYLVPAIEQVIVSVDTEAGAVVIRPLKGIFDDEN